MVYKAPKPGFRLYFTRFNFLADVSIVVCTPNCCLLCFTVVTWMQIALVSSISQAIGSKSRFLHLTGWKDYFLSAYNDCVEWDVK